MVLVVVVVVAAAAAAVVVVVVFHSASARSKAPQEWFSAKSFTRQFYRNYFQRFKLLSATQGNKLIYCN